MVTTARDIMTQDAQCVQESQTLVDAARKMRDLDVGALPICGDDDRLKGMITDRDIVIRCLAADGDPATTTAGSLADGETGDHRRRRLRRRGAGDDGRIPGTPAPGDRRPPAGRDHLRSRHRPLRPR